MKDFLQRLGRSMLIPIAALPMAGLLMRVTAPDMLDIELFQAAGIVLKNMDILIAIGVAMGLSRTEDRGIPALTGFLAITILKQGLFLMNPELNMSIFGGLLSGVIAAYIYNKFKDTKLPDVFAFFGGEKFPITMIILVMIPVAGIASMFWPYAQAFIDSIGHGMVKMGAFGVFLFGLLNRFLLPFGLHHVLNSYIYFGLGSYTTSSGEVVTGEITRFVNGDPTAGTFLGGFFITMLFGIPAIALAITNAANEDQKKETKALMSSGALTSFIAGITEPIEFSFLFASPLLYTIHAFYAGLAGATLYILNIRHGFFRGASIIDFVLNFNLSDKGILIIPVGLVFFALYYFTFYTLITKKDIELVGRMKKKNIEEEPKKWEENLELSHENYEYMARKIIQNIGGKDNILSHSNCVTRIRLELKDNKLINEEKIKQTGAHGVVKIGEKSAQIVIGPEVSNVYKEFKKQIK